MPLTIKLDGKRVRLLPEGALFWRGTLVVADVDASSAAELARLGGLAKRMRARRLVVLGSPLPPEWRERYPKVEVVECGEEPWRFSEGYTLAAPVRPAIGLRGRAGQSVRLPCFCFGPRAGILPAFSRAGDAAEIHPAAEDRVYAIAGEDVLPVNV